MLRRFLCLFLAGAALSIPSLPPFATLALADAKSVFAEASPSIVVVLAQNNNGEQQAQGSGVVIAKGIVITNCHVIEGAAKVQLRQAADSRGAESYRMDAEVVAKDEDKDLCLLYAADLSAPPAAKSATMGAAKALTIGEEVYAIGAPQGLDLSLSRGIVAQLRGVKGKAPVIQTDAAISPGSSGGGLFNEDAELVGITTFRYEEGENLNFAMPVEDVSALLKTIRQEIAQKQVITDQWQQCIGNPTYQCVMDLAMKTTQQIDDAYSRVDVLGHIAEAQVTAGDISGAKQTINTAIQIVRQIDHDKVHFDVLIAKTQAITGDIGGAKQIARQIENGYYRDTALREIAIAQAKAGDISGAKQTSQDKDALRHIAIAQAKAGDIKGAKKTAWQIAGKVWSTFGYIAVAQAEAGNINGAEQTVQEIEYAPYRAFALVSIAVVQVKTGNISGAEQTINNAKQIAQQMDRKIAEYDHVLQNIAIAQAESGDISGAKRTFQKIESNYGRVYVLQDIAEAQAKTGDINEAKQTINNAMQIVRQIDFGKAHYDVLNDIAKTQARIGDIGGAKQTARHAWRDIAIAQAKREDFVGAMQTAQTIDYYREQAMALVNIAKALATQ